MTNELYIGVMSGTSLDGIDAVLARVDEEHFSIIDSASIALPQPIRQEIKALSIQGNNEIEKAATLGIELSLLTGDLINQLLASKNVNPSTIRAIGYHGQTIRHRPDARHPYSIQIGCGSTLALKTNITTITDFRMADIAAGGQGAPLVPAFHQYAFQTKTQNRFIINIGGIANLTFLPADEQAEIIGFDTGPGNTLLDEWINLHKGKSFDQHGEWAGSGKLMPDLLESMMKDDFICKPIPKSTGKEHFNLAWLSKHTNVHPAIRPEDIQRTLTEFTACSIAFAITQLQQAHSTAKAHIYLCGGGINNATLVQALQNQLPEVAISSTQALDIHPQLVECSAFAWLARQTLTGKPGNLTSVTGASEKRILGGVYFA